MPELICDTSALLALHQVGLLHVLSALGSAVTVPTAVERELATGRSAGHDVPDVAGLDWTTIRPPNTTPALPDAEDLDAGESDVLWLVLETPGSVAILDDAAARRVASRLGVPFTGTLGLLVDAKHRGLIPAVAPVLDELDHHHFHMSPGIRQMILRTAGETP